MIDGCGSQLRLAMIQTPDGITTRPIGLDYTAITLVGAAQGVDLAMLTEILPRIEAAILTGSDGDDGRGDFDDNS